MAEPTVFAQDAMADRVWRAAATLFREEGYAAATTRQLSERLGFTKATLYYYVSKKEDLLHRICVEALTSVDAAVRQAVDAATLERKLSTLVRTHLVTMLSDDIDMHATMLLELRALTGERRVEVVGLRDNYEAFVHDTILETQDAGFLRKDLTTKNLTLCLLSLMNWPITWFRSGGSMTSEQMSDLTTSLFIDGAGAPTIRSQPAPPASDTLTGRR